MKHEKLLFILTFVVLLRIPSLFEPYWYNDEGIYLTIGRAVNQGQVLYRDIMDYPSKPPLLYMVAAAVRGNLFWFKFVAMVWILATIMIFWALAVRWRQEIDRFVVATTLMFGVIVCWPGWEGNSVNAEIFFLLPNLISMYLLLSPRINKKSIYLAGFFVGIASLFKFQAGLELLIWPIVWVVEKDQQLKKQLGYLILGWATPVGISLGWYGVNGLFIDYVRAVTSANVEYVSGLRMVGMMGITVGGIWLVVLKKQALHRLGVVWCAWGMIALAAALFSGRPYPHYLLQLAPVVALGMGIAAVGYKAQKYAVVAGFVVVIWVWQSGNYYKYRSFGYFANFIKWSLGQKTDSEYLTWFGAKVPVVYSFSKIIGASSTGDEKMYVWGDSSLIYPLAERLPAYKYMVRFHINDAKERDGLAARLEQSPPKYIVVEGDESQLSGLSSLLSQRYLLEKEGGGSRLYRRLGYN